VVPTKGNPPTVVDYKKPILTTNPTPTKPEQKEKKKKAALFSYRYHTDKTAKSKGKRCRFQIKSTQ
jgi:hypothetical protein